MIKNILKIIMKILKIALIIIIVLFASFVLLQRFSNNNTSIFGYRMFAVVTGSMEPVYSVGDVILCKEVDTNKLFAFSFKPENFALLKVIFFFL